MTSSIKNTSLNINIKIAILLVLIFILRSNVFVFKTLNNWGIPQFQYQELWFFLIPGIYIVLRAYVNSKLKIPYLNIFLLFVVIHYFMENYFYGAGYKPHSPIDLIYRMYYIYFTFIILVNAGGDYFEYTLKIFIMLLAFNTAAIYLDLIGVLNIANIDFGTRGFEGRLNSDINLNLVNDQNVSAIIVFFILKYLGYKVFRSAPLIIFYFCPLIFLNASRGSVGLLVLGILIYLFSYWGQIKIYTKIFMLLAFLSLLLIETNIFAYLVSNIEVFNRFSMVQLNEYEGEGRILQIIASWENFIKSPIYGLGYNSASANVFAGITRSNFHYTQILASGGISLFLIYFYFLFKLFAQNIQMLFTDKIILTTFLFVFVTLFFRRPDHFLAVLAFIAYFQSLKYGSNREKNE